MKKAVNLVFKGGIVKEFFIKSNKLYEKAKFSDQEKFEFIWEVKSDQGMLQFLFLRKEDTYEKFKETCLEYANNKKVFKSRVQEEQVTDESQGLESYKGK